MSEEAFPPFGCGGRTKDGKRLERAIGLLLTAWKGGKKHGPSVWFAQQVSANFEQGAMGDWSQSSQTSTILVESLGEPGAGWKRCPSHRMAQIHSCWEIIQLLAGNLPQLGAKTCLTEEERAWVLAEIERIEAVDSLKLSELESAAVRVRLNFYRGLL